MPKSMCRFCGAVFIVALSCGSAVNAAQPDMVSVSGGFALMPRLGELNASFFAGTLEFAIGTHVSLGPVLGSGTCVRELPEDDKDEGTLVLAGVAIRAYPSGLFRGFYVGGMARLVVIDFTAYDWNAATDAWVYDEDYSDSLRGPGFTCGGKFVVAPHVFVDPSVTFGFLFSEYHRRFNRSVT
jgi:hypothetical protein